MDKIFFAQIREDSVVERTVASRIQPSKVICIGSGGCTALSLLTDKIQNVYCVDNNTGQCALAELKKAGIKHLDRKKFLGFLGEKKCTNRIEIYNEIKNELPEYALEYWSHHLHHIEYGINKCGVTEIFYQYISSHILKIYDDETWYRLFNCKNIKEQKEFYDQHFRNDTWTMTIRSLLSKTSHLQFFPAYMFAQSAVNDFSDFFLKQFEKEINTKPIHDNYFLSQFILSEYLYDQPEGMPFYLAEEGYQSAKRNIEKLIVSNSTLQNLCSSVNDIDCFMLSNVFDWADEPQRMKIFEGIYDCKSGSSFLLFRNMFASVNVSHYLKENSVADPAYADSLYQRERSMMYSKISFVNL